MQGIKSEKSGDPLVVDAQLALEKLGFSEERAAKAVQSAMESIGSREIAEADAGEIVRLALGRL